MRPVNKTVKIQLFYFFADKSVHFRLIPNLFSRKSIQHRASAGNCNELLCNKILF